MIEFPKWVKVSKCETSSKTELEPTVHGMVKRAVSNKIQFGTGWNCCAARPAKVIVFSNGARWAVCKSCASMYTGEVQELPSELIPA
jgi:hypothetical protein